MALSDIQNQTLIYQNSTTLPGGGGGGSTDDGVCLETLILPPLRRKFLSLKIKDPCCPQVQIRKRKRLNFFPIINTMNRRPTTCPKLDLRLNLSPPRPYPHNDHRRLSLDSISPNQSSEYSISPPSSCLSSELSQEDPAVQLLTEDDGGPMITSSSTSSMVLVGCPRCLMYVMLSEDDPKCPKCKSSVLLDFVGGGVGSVNTIRTAPPAVTTTVVDGYDNHRRTRK